jgi:hypothetical protein
MPAHLPTDLALLRGFKGFSESEMKTLSLKSERCCFQMLIPQDWSSSLLDDLSFVLSELNQTFVHPAMKLSDSKTFTGPEDRYLNILITPLLPDEAEPGLRETGEYFARLAEQFDLNVIKTGTIGVANKEHFCATYYRGRPYRPGPIYFYKKYVLYQDRVEYLLTACLYALVPGRPLPTDAMLRASEKEFDGMVATIELVPAEGHLSDLILSR